MNAQWPPLRCRFGKPRCGRPVTHSVATDRASTGCCADHIQAAKEWCGPGKHTARKLPDAAEPDQPDLFTDPNGDAA